VAKILGGIRNPLSGEHSRHTAGDIIHDKYFVEVKSRKRIPFLKTFKEICEKAKKESKIPLLVMHEKGKKIDLVMLKLEDFANIKKGFLVEGERK